MNKYDLALNPNTPPEVLKELFYCDSFIILLYLSRNPNTPRQIQKYLYYYERNETYVINNNY